MNAEQKIQELKLLVESSQHEIDSLTELQRHKECYSFWADGYEGYFIDNIKQLQAARHACAEYHPNDTAFSDMITEAFWRLTDGYALENYVTKLADERAGAWDYHLRKYLDLGPGDGEISLKLGVDPDELLGTLEVYLDGDGYNYAVLRDADLQTFISQQKEESK